jgi:hypothetical protein
MATVGEYTATASLNEPGELATSGEVTVNRGDDEQVFHVVFDNTEDSEDYIDEDTLNISIEVLGDDKAIEIFDDLLEVVINAINDEAGGD